MKKLTTRQIALNGVVAGLYAAITILTASFAYGNIQFRIADALCVLVVLEPSLTVGLTLGCLISNIFSTVSALDIVIGTAGTLLGCLLAARVKKDWLVPVPVILANAVLVGAMLAYVLTPDALIQGFFINGGEVLVGEAVVLYLCAATSVLPALGADGKASARHAACPGLRSEQRYTKQAGSNGSACFACSAVRDGDLFDYKLVTLYQPCVLASAAGAALALRNSWIVLSACAAVRHGGDALNLERAAG